MDGILSVVTFIRQWHISYYFSGFLLKTHYFVVILIFRSIAQKINSALLSIENTIFCGRESRCPFWSHANINETNLKKKKTSHCCLNEKSIEHHFCKFCAPIFITIKSGKIFMWIQNLKKQQQNTGHLVSACLNQTEYLYNCIYNSVDSVESCAAPKLNGMKYI